MARKFIRLGILVMVLVFGMTVVGCNDDSANNNEGNKTITFSLDKVSNTIFSITVDGAKWNNNAIDSYGHPGSGLQNYVNVSGSSDLSWGGTSNIIMLL